MQQIETLPFEIAGAAADDIVDGHALAIEAWGDRASNKDSGLLAFAYLWRRFGPPWRGGDNHKSLVDYWLTTADPEVFLTLSLKGCGLALSVGYVANQTIRTEAHAPLNAWERRLREWWLGRHPEIAELEDTEANHEIVSARYWKDRMNKELVDEAVLVIGEFPDSPDSSKWRDDTGVVHRVNQALFDALKELERPVYVRDCPFNAFGRCEAVGDSADTSKYAGYGIPREAMDAVIEESIASE